MFKRVFCLISIIFFIFVFCENSYADWKTKIFGFGKKEIASPAKKLGKKFVREKTKEEYDDYKRKKEKDDMILKLQKGKR